MGKIIRNLKVAVDLRTLTEKEINENTQNLLKHPSWKGSLGGVTVISEIFDLYLLVPPSKIQETELFRWLKAAQVEKSFRMIKTIDENLRDYLLSSSIGVTITSNYELARSIKEITRTYLLKRHQIPDINPQILKMSQWREVVRDLSFFSSTEK